MELFKTEYSCVIITGGSRGYGLATIQQLIQQFKHDSTDSAPKKCHFIILTKNPIPSSLEDIPKEDPRIVIETLYCDLSKSETIREQVKPFLEDNYKKTLKDCKQCLLIHNSGSLGDVKTLCENLPLENADNDGRLHDYCELNVFSVMKLTALVLQTFRESLNLEDLELGIVNISSLAAIQSFYGCNDYCTGKATREAYFRQLNMELEAQEKLIETGKKRKNIRILNWAPGPLSTDMYDVLKNNSLITKDFKNCQPLKPEVSARALLDVVIWNGYKNCDHIDFYDEKHVKK